MRIATVIAITIAVCIWAHAASRCVAHFTDLMENRLAVMVMYNK